MFPKWARKQVLMRGRSGPRKMRGMWAVRRGMSGRCIYLEVPRTTERHGGPRYAVTYQIHKTRCIFCGYERKAWPVSAIFMGKDYDSLFTARTTSCGTKEICWFRSRPNAPSPAER